MTTDAKTSQAREIYLQAVRMDDDQARQRYLDDACGSETKLRARVEKLLRANAVGGIGLLAQAVPALGSNFRVAGDSARGDNARRNRTRRDGYVYMAQQTEPVKRKVALKIIKPGMDTKVVVTRFEAERRALAMMDHANIAKVLDGGSTAEGRPYLVMELVRGVPLTEFCAAKKLGFRERLELFIDIYKAVQHAH